MSAMTNSVKIKFAGLLRGLLRRLNDDEATEDAFYAAEARTNADFADYGFAVDTIVVEARDYCEVPPHFTLLTA